MGSLPSAAESKQVLILGLGNPLLGDDGIGMRITTELAGVRLPAGVSVRQGGIAGLGLLDLIAGFQRVIVVDAAEMGCPPGHVVRFTSADVQFKTAKALLSPHQIGLGEVLALAEALGVAPPELVIIGVQPDQTEVGAGLSPEVEGAIPAIIELVLDEIQVAGMAQAPA